MRTQRGSRPYANNWKKTCRSVRDITSNRCVGCLAKAELVHHLYYRKGILNQPVYGRESPGMDIVPLCRQCHGNVHEHAVWLKHKKDPDRDRNVGSTIWQLRIQFLLVAAWKPLSVVVLLGVLFGSRVLRLEEVKSKTYSVSDSVKVR